MRPLRLDLDGFTVFREPTTVDFADVDFFALVGPTGAGKSTVLDAITFALYGTVPRWGDRRAIANALAPSAAEARVRLVFESAGARYVISRVVRRDGKGNVSTRHAGLEALPHGFDLSRFDAGLAASAALAAESAGEGPGEDIGEVIAGTPAEVDAAVLEVVGLPYEQFTKCVVVPQGEFAAFLHAKPAERQRILVNLLGLDVYGRIRERANGLATAADARLAAIDQHLAGMADADDAALAAATERVGTLQTLAGEVDAVVPRLALAVRAADDAAGALADLDGRIGLLTRVAVPADAATLAKAAAAARARVAESLDAVTAAEEDEEKLRGQLGAAGDATALRRLLDAHAERERLGGEAATLAATLGTAESEHTKASAALDKARAEAKRALQALDDAREAYQAAVATDRAAALRPHLRVGDACPVCTQTVAVLPAAKHDSTVAAAEAAGKAAKQRSAAAEQAVEERDRAVRELDRGLAAARAHAEQVQARLARLDGSLAGAPAPAALRRDLDAIARLSGALDDAAAAVRAAREAQRKASAAAARADDRLRAAWRAFDAARDALATLGPPPAERDDLATAWAELAAWTTAEVTRLRAEREAADERVRAARGAADEVGAALRRLFIDAGLPEPAGPDAGPGPGRSGVARSRAGRHATGGPGPSAAAGDPATAAAVALERAEADRRRIEERRGDAERLRAQRAGVEREGQVAKTLVQHLRADRFERWLLAEALDTLVEGASRTLRELSGGQYDLGHEKGEFFVVDHHDAGLRRAVRTLSGGETFQASLALALALSEQLAGLSTAAASLESIVLDEGFGTLDATTLDTVAATLENLAAKGDRMVGVVTHVSALAERIPARFEVHRDARTAHVRRVGV
jgi:exonuclease SbcC